MDITVHHFLTPLLLLLVSSNYSLNEILIITLMQKISFGFIDQHSW